MNPINSDVDSNEVIDGLEEYQKALTLLDIDFDWDSWISAKELLQLSAFKGYSQAYYKLGTIYDDGYPFGEDLDLAEDYYQQAIKYKNENAMYRLAKLYCEKQSDRVSFEVPLKLLMMMNITNNYDAIYLLGYMMWFEDEGLNCNFKQALKYLHIAADKGDHSKAQFVLGLIYEFGVKSVIGEDFKNPSKAAFYYKKASSSNHAEAQFRYAIMLKDGRGISRNYEESFICLWKSLINGYRYALYELAKFYVSDLLFPVDNTTAYILVLISHEYNDSSDAHTLENELSKNFTPGDIIKYQKIATDYSKLHLGTDSTPLVMNFEEYLKRFSWLNDNHKTESDTVEEQVTIPSNYNPTIIDQSVTNGESGNISSDPSNSNLHSYDADYYFKESQNNRKYGLQQALEFLETAANLGHPDADYEYAKLTLYSSMDYYDRSYEEGMHHLKIALENKHLDAMYLYGELCLSGIQLVNAEAQFAGIPTDTVTFLSVDKTKAISAFTDAAMLGHAQSQFKLHEIYEEGVIVPLNNQKSFEWLKKAAYSGYNDAYPKLVKEYETGIFQNLDEAYIWAVISKASGTYLNASTALESIETAINDPNRVLELQNEASRRHEILLQRALTDNDMPDFTLMNAKEVENCFHNVASQPPSKASYLTFKDWQVKDAKDIKIVLNLGDKIKTINVEHLKDKATFMFRELFTDNCISLLVKHYQSINEGKEPIKYIEYSVATKNSKRKNHEIVSDFNTQFRELMGHKGVRNFKAFEWIGRAKSNRSLKANIQIEVYI